MKYIMKEQQCNINTHTFFAVSCITAFYGLAMPGAISSGAKWMILKRATGKGTNVLSAMFYNQLSIIVVMTTFGLAALAITNPSEKLFGTTEFNWVLPLICIVSLILLLALCLLALSRRTADLFLKIITPVLRPLPEKLRRKAYLTLEQIAIYQTVGWAFHFKIAMLTAIASLAGNTLIQIFAALAANIHVPMAIFIWLSSIVYILSRLPISLANTGPREMTLLGFLAIYGVHDSNALVMSMILLSAHFFLAFIGAGYQMFWAAPSFRDTNDKTMENTELQSS